MNDTAITAAVQQIHATPHKLVLSFAGAGSLALWWLHSVGGSSRTVLEASDHYAAASLTDFIGTTPAQFVGGPTAQAMARCAYDRAVFLASDDGPLLGVGCTATIATDRAKRGEHRCVVAVQRAHDTATYALVLRKGHRDRIDEETLVAQLLLHAISHGCDLAPAIPLDLLDDEHVDEETR